MTAFAYMLRHKIVIQQQSTEQDEACQPLDVWNEVATVYADIRHQGGLESIKSGAVTSVVKASIRIRYRTGINSGMRVLHGSTVYNILAVLPDMVGKRHVDLVTELVS